MTVIDNNEQIKIQAIQSNVYTIHDISKALGVTHRTLCEYIKAGRLKGTNIGGKWIICADNLLSFLNGSTEKN